MPTEELFGAYNFVGESPARRSKFMGHLRTINVRISESGLEQALKGDAIASPADRGQLAKLLNMVAAEGSVGMAKSDKRRG